MNLMNRLAECANELDAEGLFSEADRVTEIMEKLSQRKYDFEEDEEVEADDAEVLIEIN